MRFTGNRTIDEITEAIVSEIMDNGYSVLTEAAYNGALGKAKFDKAGLTEVVRKALGDI